MKAFKNDENLSLFHVKSSFRSWDIYIFVLTFWDVEKWLDKKVIVNFKIYDVPDSTTNNNYNTHIP